MDTIKLKCEVCGAEFDKEKLKGCDQEWIYVKICPDCDKKITTEVENKMLNDARYERGQQLRKIVKESRLPDDFLEYDINKGNPGLYNFVKEHKSESIFICGYTGITKTRSVVSVAYQMIVTHMEYLKIRYWKATELMRILAVLYSESNLREAENIIRKLSEADLLILDDLGKEVLTNRAGEHIWEIIDNRYVHKKTLWITTNLNGNELEDHFDERGTEIIRRLRDMCETWPKNERKAG